MNPVASVLSIGFLVGCLIVVSAVEAADQVERHALLIGVSKYHPDRFEDLPGAEPDVRELGKVLERQGYPSQNVTVMSSRSGATDPRLLPSAKRIRRQLQRLKKVSNPSAVLIVAFAGHGVQPVGGEYFFCPQDADLADPSTLIPVAEIYRAMDQSRAGIKLLLVDACRSSTSVQVSTIGDGLQSVSGQQARTGENVPEPPPDTAAFFSCMAGEFAFERHGKSGTHGVFFHAIIQGLDGSAARNGSQIMLPDLERFVKKRVRAYVEQTYSSIQRPAMRNNTQKLVPLVEFSRNQQELERAYEMSIRGQRDEAEETVDQILEASPDDVFALSIKSHLVSERAESTGDQELLAEALRSAERAVELDSSSADALVARAEVHRIRGKMDQAKHDCDLALKCDRNHVLAHVTRAVVSMQRGATRSMLADIQRAVELSDADPIARSVYAAILFSQNQMDKGFAVIDRGLELTPDVPALHFIRGYGFAQSQDHDSAINAFTAGIRIDPYDDDLRCRRAASLINVGDYEAAMEDVQVAAEQNPLNSDVTALKVLVYTKQQRLLLALGELNLAIDRDADRAEWYRMRSSVLTRLGRNQEAARDQKTLNLLRTGK